MLEYFGYKKYKKHKQEKEGEREHSEEGRAAGSKNKHAESGVSTAATSPAVVGTPSTSAAEEVPVLDRDEQSFLERLTLTWGESDNDDDVGGDEAGQRPPLPPRMKTPELTWDSDSESFVREKVKGKGKDKDKGVVTTEKDAGKGEKSSTSNVGRRFSTLFSSKQRKKSADKDAPTHPAHLAVPGHVDGENGSTAVATVPTEEEARERADLAKVLDDLDLAARTNGTSNKKDLKSRFNAVPLSAESAELVRRFVVVLKDLVHGVPTAADDLRHLLDDRDGTLQRGFERLPSSLRKLVTQLPTKLTSTLAPELLAVAAESQGIKYGAAAAEGEATSGAKSLGAKAMGLLPLLTKPNAIVKMLKAIMNALKLRWPAFIGTSAIWSVALFLLLFVLWYCHKRGRETRLEKEAAALAAGGGIAGPSTAGALTDGDDADLDAALPTAPVTIRTTAPPADDAEPLPASKLPPPPIGSDAAKPKK